VPRIDGKNGTVRSLGPDLGAHTRQVLSDLLMLDASTIERLAAEGVI
jgi:crotonobetainyl-CoA:carnitine CoA-transferase CaiB-like acyl-CoA transferase